MNSCFNSSVVKLQEVMTNKPPSWRSLDIDCAYNDLQKAMFFSETREASNVLLLVSLLRETDGIKRSLVKDEIKPTNPKN